MMKLRISLIRIPTALLALFHGAIKVGQCFAAFEAEGCAVVFQLRNSVEAKHTKIVAQLAPGNERPHLAPKPQAERSNASFGGSRLGFAIGQRETMLCLHGTFDLINARARTSGVISGAIA